MTDENERMCVLLPVGEEQRWAVPQTCVAEIMTLQAGAGDPPEAVCWRGVDIPVLDPGRATAQPWQDPRSGSGLLAVILGVAGQDCDYWAVALRGDGLAIRRIADGDCEDQPQARDETALAAFSLDGSLYQVPDLPALQQQAANRRA